MFQVEAQESLALVVRIREGDPAAEDEFVRVFSKIVSLMVLARTHDPEAARDLTQEVLLAVLQALRKGQIREPENLSAYVYGTARNLVSNYFRVRGQQLKVESLSLDPLMTAQTTDDREHSERINLVRRALERLDLTDRKILLMTLVEGLTPGEIAGQLNLTPEVARQRKSRAVKKVVECVRKMSRK
jgi:RNA polymerase sigma-70 factor (ECF subfamily)